MNKLLLLAFAAAVTGTTLDYHPDAGWCDGPNHPDDCQMDDGIACPSGENAEIAAACWAVCEAKYPNLVAVDITAVDEEEAVFEGMCQCCCSSECTCLSDIRKLFLSGESGLASGPHTFPIPWLACTVGEDANFSMSETNYVSRLLL